MCANFKSLYIVSNKLQELGTKNSFGRNKESKSIGIYDFWLEE